MTNPPHPFPLDQFLKELTANGMVVDLRQRIAIQRVLEGLDEWPKHPSKNVGLYIAPIVAHSVDEQEKFHRLWNDFIQRELPPLPPLPPPPPPPDRFAICKKWLRRLWLPVVALGVGLLLAWVYWVPLEVPEMEIYVLDIETGPLTDQYSTHAITGDRIWIHPIAKGNHSSIDSAFQDSAVRGDAGRMESTMDKFAGFDLKGMDFKWQINGRDTAKGHSFEFDAKDFCSISLIVEKRWLWRTVRDTIERQLLVECKGKPRVTSSWERKGDKRVLFTADLSAHDSPQSLEVRWEFGDGTVGNRATELHQYDTIGLFDAKLTVTDLRYPDCPYTESPVVDNHDSLDNPPPPKAILPDLPIPPTQYTYTRRVSIVWGIAFVLLASGFAYLLAWWINRRKTLAANAKQAERQERFRANPGGPYNIPWPSQDGRIAWDENLDRVAAAMAGRSIGERMHLDMGATVRATIARAGMPTLRFRGHTRPMSWLVLVDEASLSTQEQRLIGWWLERLRGESVELEDYGYRNRPDVCWRVGKTGVTNLPQMQALYGDHRLIVVSRGEGLMDPAHNVIRDPLQHKLQVWAHRTLLTPENPLTWAGRERALATLFGICPVESKAMLQYFLLPYTPEGEGYRDWKKQLLRQKAEFQTPELPPRVSSFAALAEALGNPQLANWAMALHTFAEPVWELIVATGADLKGPDKRVTWDELWKVVRLPFLLEERYYPKLRKEALATTGNAVLTSGHQTVVHLLAGAASILKEKGQSGMAKSEIAREMALQQYAIDPENQENRKALAAMEAEGLELPFKPPMIPPKGQFPAWAVAAIFLIFLGLITTGLITEELPVGADNRSFSSVMRLDSTEIPDTTAQEILDSREAYLKGKALYEKGKYEEANNVFVPALRDLTHWSTMIGDEMLRDTLLDSTLVAYLDNGIGLCHYYLGDITNAVSYLTDVLKANPRFFQEVAVGDPNLQSLIKTSGVFRTVVGTVRDIKGAPIFEANIVVKQLLYEKAYSGFTDEDGKFSIEYDPSELEWHDSLLISAPGYISQVVAIVPGDSLKLKLKNAPCVTNYNFFGTVRTKGQQQVVGFKAFVDGGARLSGLGNTFRADACGRIGDKVHVIIEASGYEKLDTIVALAPKIDFVMRKMDPINLEAIILQGTVTDAEGNAIPNYEVLPGGFHDPKWPANPGKSFEIKWNGQIPQGAVDFMIVAPGYDTLIERIVVPARGQQFVLRKSKIFGSSTGNKEHGVGPDEWHVTVQGREYKRKVMDFEIFVDDVSIRKANPKDDGELFIPEASLNGTGGKVKIKALGYADKVIYVKDWDEVTIEMELHPEIKKLIGDMVAVKGGTFSMGSKDGYPDEIPMHQVALIDFSIGRYEVTQAQLTALMGSNPSSILNCDDCPAQEVSWYDCQSFFHNLQALTGQKYHLPSEAQWEYAARGGQSSKGYSFAGGNDPDKVAYYDENAGNMIHPVGRKAANELGLFDMTGNVWEWCLDGKREYRKEPVQNPVGPLTGARVLRGGSVKTIALRIYHRNTDLPNAFSQDIGFRVARD